jgi:phosphoglycerate dehydrogenase-like enzyme
MPEVLCLRPAADFARVGVTPPFDLDVHYRAPADADVPALMRKVAALVVPAVGPKLGAELFAGGRLSLVQVTGAGVDRLDRAALVAQGIPVANVPGGSNDAVAEYAVAAAASLLRRFAWSNDEIRIGNYSAFRARLLTDNVGGLDGLLAGIVGMGTIGTAVAHAFHRAGCRIAFYDPADDTGEGVTAGAQRMPLDELLAAADIVSLHVPLLEGTRNMIDSAALTRMKPGAVLINAARGGIVDEAALAARLAEGKLGGAAVDVYATEPPPADNPLLSLTGEAAHRLLLTPHIAGVTRQSAALLFREAWKNVERVLLHGDAPRFRVY